MVNLGAGWAKLAAKLGIGALVVAGVVALVLPSSATDPSGLSAKLVSAATIPTPMDVHTTGTSDVEVARLAIPPGTDAGWHEHRGYVLVTVLEGTATFYDSGDPECKPHRYHAGDGLMESPGHPHITRNEGPEPLVLYVVAITPHGRGSDIAEPASPACHF